MYFGSHSIFFSLAQKFGFLNAVRHVSSIAKEVTSPQWDIASAVCLERKPVILQNLTSIENKHSQLMERIEFEQSFINDHEIHLLKDLERAEKSKSGIELDESFISTNQTAQDFEDQSNREFNSFHPAATVTEADLQNNQKSIHRKLDSTLFLILKQKLGNDYQWIFPQTLNASGESLRKTAERAIEECCGSDVMARFTGNAPIGYYKYKYPKVMRRENGVLGAKVFFFRAHLVQGNIFQDKLRSDRVADFVWLGQNELCAFFADTYCKAVEAFMFSDST